jgi:hypothetical protein
MAMLNYRYMRFIILLASTIMVAMGLTLYHGMHIHDIDFRCGIAKKIRFIYELYHIRLEPLWPKLD